MFVVKILVELVIEFLILSLKKSSKVKILISEALVVDKGITSAC